MFAQDPKGPSRVEQVGVAIATLASLTTGLVGWGAPGASSEVWFKAKG